MENTNINTEEKTGIYEAGFHLLPTATEAEAGKEFEAIKTMISENGGVFIAEGLPEMTALAYDISKNIGGVNKKFEKSYFGWVKFEMESAKVEKVSQGLKAMASVLRFILVSTVKENTMYTKRSPVMRKENNISETDVIDTAEVLPEVETASKEDIDKSIEELVIN